MGRTISQTVDFLGFLRGQLQGLQGITTLCYELIQNADDVRDEAGNPGASCITFDVRDDALWVENDGVFRERDFERMRRLSWGDKSRESNTIGAFGIGFISVYQITDSPEIFSSGQHWIFRPEQEENKRILVEEVETENTRFRLPWAFENTRVRRELEIPPVPREDLEKYVEEISQAIEHAALFLRQITTLEVRRNGELVRRIGVIRADNECLIYEGNDSIVWRIFRGDFSHASSSMLATFGELLETRETTVQIAVPERPLSDGLLFAFLPSETHTGLPFHINADFFPSPDRKRILFGDDYKSEWNRLAIRAAAETLANAAEGLLEFFEPKLFWEFAQRVKRASEQATFCSTAAEFWAQLKPKVGSLPTTLTSSGQRRLPSETFFLDAEELVKASAIFEDLGLPIVHSELRSYRNILLETGVRLLKTSDVVGAMHRQGYTERTEKAKMPSTLRTYEQWSVFWSALEVLYQKEGTGKEGSLKRCAIAFGSDGALWPPAELFAADRTTQNLFGRLKEIAWFDSRSYQGAIPKSLVPKFRLHDGIEILENSQVLLQDLWDERQFDIAQMYEWLEGHKNEINGDVRVQQKLRSYAIWPAADGTLRALDELYLPGDFEDPLGLAQLVDVKALKGRSEFLRNTLSVPPLDFKRYVNEWVPKAIEDKHLETTRKLRLLRVLAENIGKLKTWPEIQSSLSKLKLVWCGDHQFMPASQVYFDTDEVRTLFNEKYPIAKVPNDAQESIRSLYEWLGVNQTPRPEHVVERIKEVVAHPPTEQSRRIIESIFDYLASNWTSWKDNIPVQFALLKSMRWLPGTRDRSQWFSAAQVYSVYRDYLFKSEGNFLDISRQTQQKGNAFIEFLGIRTEPPPELVAKHLLHLSNGDDGISTEFYRYLNRKADERTIALLKDEPCLYLKLSSDQGRWVRPDQVFWDDHPFGQYRYRLGPEFGSFKSLLDRLGVRDKPDYRDAIAILVEIANSRFAQSNLPVTDHPEHHIVLAAWQILSTALQQGIVTKEEIRRELSEQKCVITTKGLLQMPSRSFFEDRPRWAEKFKLIQNDIIPRTRDCWPAMEAAGVQRLSQAVETHLVDLVSPQPDTVIPKRLHERELLIRRIEGNHPLQLERIHNIEFQKAERIGVIRQLSAFSRVEKYIDENVDAILLNGTLYYRSSNNIPFAGIARELSFALMDGDNHNVLASALKDILGSPTFGDAESILDNLGYPPLKEHERTRVQVATVMSLGEEQELSEQPKEESFSYVSFSKQLTSSKETESLSPLGERLGQKSDPKPSQLRKAPKRSETRLLSYVEPQTDEHQNVQEKGEESPRLRAIGERGIEIVKAFERAQGREPEDVNVDNPNNPGFDIKSFDPETGKTRYIEVKALTGDWDGRNPARMTKTEFEMAYERGDNAWLYVVELVESDSPHIYCIQAPVQKIDRYCFDHGWQKVSESFDASPYVKT